MLWFRVRAGYQGIYLEKRPANIIRGRFLYLNLFSFFLFVCFPVILKASDFQDYFILFPKSYKRWEWILPYLNLPQSHPHCKCRSREQCFPRMYIINSQIWCVNTWPFGRCPYNSASLEARLTAGILPACFLLWAYAHYMTIIKHREE